MNTLHPMKRLTPVAAMAVFVLLTACQQTQTSKPEAATSAPTAAPAAPAASASAPTAAAAPAAAPAVPGEIIIDDGDPGFKSEGSWTSGSGGNDYKDEVLWTTPTADNETANTATWTPDIKNAGAYDVYEWHGDDVNTDHASNEPFTIKSEDGTQTIKVDLRSNNGKWNLLGTFKFAAGKEGSVTASSAKVDNNVLADAVKFVPHQ